MADDLVAGAVAELYGADPDAFTERRKALALAAREAGDRAAATAIAALRKPTRSAWVVNRLARSDPDAPGRLAALAAELRAAERAKDGPRLRELSADRGALIDALTDRALAATGVFDPPSSLREEVTATLTSALADPGTAAAFAAGNLTKAAQWSGFGYAEVGPAEEPAPDGARSPDSAGPAPVDIASRRRTGRAKLGRAGPGPSAPAAARRTAPEQSQRAEREQSQRAEREQSQRAAQERRLAEEEQRAAQEAAERAARAREKFDDAERALAQASAVAAEAGAVEDRLEAQVRDLEGRLTTAREDLAAARRHARHAEAAERRARQALDRMPRPLRRKGLCRSVLTA